MSDEAEVEAKALDMGWVPKEDFKGAEEKWIPAAEFVERGEHLLPLLHATNKRLKGDVETMKGQVAELNGALREARETMAALETYHDEDVKRKVEQARTNLKEQLAEASSRGDHVAVAEVTEQLTDLKASERKDTERREQEEEQRKANANRRPDATKDPAFIAWKEDNPWYGTDMVRTAIANTLSFKLRDPDYEGYLPPSVKNREFMDKLAAGVEAEIRKLTGGRGNGSQKVEDGGARSGGGGGGTKGKSYADLPAEAKQACDSFEKQLVGPNKMYKTKSEWQKKYVDRHFNE